MNYKTVLLALAIALIPLAKAHNAEEGDSIPVRKTAPVSLQATTNISFLAPKGSFNKKVIHSYAVSYYDVRVKFNHNPTFQVGLLYGDFNHVNIQGKETPYKSRINNLFALFGGVECDLIKTGRFRAGLDCQNGIAYCTAPYNHLSNTDNRMLGSHLNMYVNIGVYVRYRLSPQWSLAMNIDGKHFSNGTVWQPNLGANTMGLSLSAQYDLAPQPLKYDKQAEKAATDHYAFDKGYYLELTGAIGLKTIRPVFDYTRDKHQAVYAFPSFSAAVMKRYHRHHATGLSLDYTYARYMDRIEKQETQEGYAGYHYSRNMLGLSCRHEFFYKHISAVFALGGYLFRQGGYYGKKHEGLLYQAVGVRYSLPFTHDRLFLGYMVKAHTFSKADCLNICIGYRL